MVVLKDFQEYNLTKALFFHFVTHFKVLNKEKLMNDMQLVSYHKQQVEQNSHLLSFAYQFAVESTYERRLISTKDFENAFNNRFSVIDPYGLNGGLCSFTDFNSGVVVNFMLKNTVFKSCSFSIQATPLEYHTKKYYTIQSQLPEITNNRLRTGNTNPDILMDGVPYDIKYWTHRSTKFNHIYPIHADQFDLIAEQHFKNVLGELTRSFDKNNLPNKKFFDKSLKKLKDLLNDKSSSWINKNLEWQTFIKNNLAGMPPNFSSPLLLNIPNNDHFYLNKVPKFVNEKIHIPNDVLESPVKTRQAIAGITRFYGRDVCEKASHATLNALHFDKNNDICDVNDTP